MEVVPFFFCQDAGGCRTGASLLIPREVSLPTAASCRLVHPCHQEHFFFCFKGEKRGFFHLFSTGFLSCAIKWGLPCISKLWQHIPVSTLPGCSPWGGQGRALPLLGCSCMVAPETPNTEASSKEAASKAAPSGFPMLHRSSSASSQNPKMVLLY